MVLDKTAKGADGGATDAGPDASANSGQTAAAEQQPSTIDEAKQYGGADVKKFIADALAADGREQKDRADKAEKEVTRLTGDHATLTGQVTTLTEQMGEITKGREAAELDKVKDDPVAAASLTARHANAREAQRLQGLQAEADRNKVAADARETEITKRGVEIDIRLAALTGGVDPKELADLVPDGDADRLAKGVALLKKTTGPVLDAEGKVKVGPDGKEIPAALRTKPASAIGSGTDATGTARSMLDKARTKDK